MSDFDVNQRALLILEMLDGVTSSNALEVGCGTGAITSRYRNLVSNLLVTDISEKLAKKHRLIMSVKVRELMRPICPLKIMNLIW